MTNMNPPANARPARKARLLGILALAVSAIALVPAGASAASTLKVETTFQAIGWHNGGDSYTLSGVVETTKARPSCMSDRDVKIEELKGGAFREVGTARLQNGEFSMLVIKAPEYQITVERKTVKKGNTKIVCKPVSYVLEPINY